MFHLTTYVAPTTFLLFFFFHDTATTEIYTLSLHDALPISSSRRGSPVRWATTCKPPYSREARPVSLVCTGQPSSRRTSSPYSDRAACSAFHAPSGVSVPPAL